MSKLNVFLLHVVMKRSSYCQIRLIGVQLLLYLSHEKMSASFIPFKRWFGLCPHKTMIFLSLCDDEYILP